MPTMGELVIFERMALLAISRGQRLAEDKAMMLHLLLARDLLVAFEAIHAFLGMDAEFVFMDNRVVLPRVTFGALARGFDERLAGLFGVDDRPLPIDQITGQDKAETNDQCDEYGTK